MNVLRLISAAGLALALLLTASPGVDAISPTSSAQRRLSGGNAGCGVARVRKPWDALSKSEQALYVEALGLAIQSGVVSEFSVMHLETMGETQAHHSCAFFAWHRRMLLAFESYLRDLDPKFACLTIPYYDVHSAYVNAANKKCKNMYACSPIFQALGGAAKSTAQTTLVYDGQQTSGLPVRGAPFTASCDDARQSCGSMLRNNLQKRDVPSGAGFSTFLELVTRSADYAEFLEGIQFGIHNEVHNAVGGVMATFASPRDVFFYSWHSAIDMYLTVFHACQIGGGGAIAGVLSEAQLAASLLAFTEATQSCGGVSGVGADTAIAMNLKVNGQWVDASQHPTLGKYFARVGDKMWQYGDTTRLGDYSYSYELPPLIKSQVLGNPAICKGLLAAVTPTPTPSSTTESREATETVTPSPSEIVAPAPSETVTPPPSESVTPAPSETVTPDPSETVTPGPSETVTRAPSDSVTVAPSDTVTPAPSEAVTPTPSETVAPSPSETVTRAPSETVTPAPTDSVTPAPSESVTSAPPQTTTPTASETVTPVSTEKVSETSPVSSSPVETAAPATTETSAPAATETVTPTASETAAPTATETVTLAPSETTTPAPSETVTPAPTQDATPSPQEAATQSPQETPAPSDAATPVVSETVAPVSSEPTTPAASETSTPTPTTETRETESTPAPSSTETPVQSETVAPATPLTPTVTESVSSDSPSTTQPVATPSAEPQQTPTEAPATTTLAPSPVSSAPIVTPSAVPTPCPNSPHVAPAQTAKTPVAKKPTPTKKKATHKPTPKKNAHAHAPRALEDDAPVVDSDRIDNDDAYWAWVHTTFDGLMARLDNDVALVAQQMRVVECLTFDNAFGVVTFSADFVKNFHLATDKPACGQRVEAVASGKLTVAVAAPADFAPDQVAFAAPKVLEAVKEEAAAAAESSTPVPAPQIDAAYVGAAQQALQRAECTHHERHHFHCE